MVFIKKSMANLYFRSLKNQYSHCRLALNDSLDLKRVFRIMLCNPYADHGGGGQVQVLFKAALEKSVCNSRISVMECSHPSRYGAGLYLYQFRHAVRRRRDVLSYDLLILQGHFNPVSLIFGYYAIIHEIPYVVVPRGDMVPNPKLFHVANSPIIKWVTWVLFGRRLLRNAAAVVVTSRQEMLHLRHAGAFVNNFHVIPDPHRV